MQKAIARFGSLTCALVLALFGHPALAEFETVASGAPVGANPFRISPVYGSVVLTFGHDSNLLLVPDAPPFHTGEQAGNFALVTLTGGVLFPVSERLSFGAELSGTLVRTFGTQPAGTSGFVTDPKDYSRHVLQPKVWARFTWPVAGGAFTLTPSYTYRLEAGSKVHAVGSKSHILRLDAGYDLSANTELTAWVMHAKTDFDVEFPGQPTRNRDGDYTEAGLALRHYFNSNRSAFSLGLAVERNNAKGRDWQFDGTRVFAGIESHLGGRFFGDLTISLSDRDYQASFDDIIPGGRDNQRITQIDGTLSYVFDSRRAIDLTVTHTSFAANDPAFAGDRTVFGLSYVMNLQ